MRTKIKRMKLMQKRKEALEKYKKMEIVKEKE